MKPNRLTIKTCRDLQKLRRKVLELGCALDLASDSASDGKPSAVGHIDDTLTLWNDVLALAPGTLTRAERELLR